MKKNENYPKYVQAMRLMDAGKLTRTVARELHMGIDTVRRMRKLYLQGGELALLRPAYSPHKEAEQKEELAIKEKGLSLRKAAVIYNIPSRSLERWMQAYNKSGLAGLARKRSEESQFALIGIRMKKILLCLLLLCSVSLQFEGIRYSLINGTFEMRLPAGYLPLYVSSGTDIDEYWKFHYPDGSYIFVSNRWSPNVQEIMSKYHYPEMAIPITNNSTVCYKGSETVVSRPDIEGLYSVPDSLFLEGFSLSARYWAEKEYKDYCVGYRNVSLSKRKAFNKAISSFCRR